MALPTSFVDMNEIILTNLLTPMYLRSFSSTFKNYRTVGMLPRDFSESQWFHLDKQLPHPSLLSHSLGHHLPLPCHCSALTPPWRCGLGSDVRSHHSVSNSALTVADLHCRGRLLSHPWHLGFQPAGAFALPLQFSMRWKGKQHTSFYYDGPTEGLLGPTVLKNFMSQLFEFYLLPIAP